MPMQLRMLKLSLGKGHQVTKQLALCVAILRYRAHIKLMVCALRALVRKVETLCKILATLSSCMY